MGEGKVDFLVERIAMLFDLETQFSFYGAYHSNHTNVLIHMVFVWPIFFCVQSLLAFTAAFAPLPLPAGTLPLQEYMVLNWSFVVAVICSIYYIAFDRKAGSLGAALVLGLCWIGANAFAQTLGWSLGWKVAVIVLVVCWIFQFIGHEVYEKRSPTMLDSLSPAILMSPFFVLLEYLTTLGYEPYPGFQRSVESKVEANTRDLLER